MEKKAEMKAGKGTENKMTMKAEKNTGKDAGKRKDSRNSAGYGEKKSAEGRSDRRAGFGERKEGRFGERPGANTVKRTAGRALENSSRKFEDRPGRKTAGMAAEKTAVGKMAASGGLSRENKKAGSALCPVYGECGGCQLLHMPYEKQLREKQKKMEKLLQGICPVHPIMGMESPYHYRNKVHAVFGHNRKGKPVSGVYKEGSHLLIPVEKCLIEDEKADEIIGTIRSLLPSFKIRTYDEDTGYGLLRHVLVRRGFATGEIMVVLVTVSPVFPSKKNFVQALRERHPDITTIVQNINGKSTSMVLGEKEHVLFGKGYIEDELCGLRFRISSRSFYQVNPIQTERLYGKAMELAGLTGRETVIDAYCGIGTIGLIAARRAKQVIGVELNSEAVRDAVQNAKRNGIENAQFYCNDAGRFMVNMAARGDRADVLFMDPPRSGSTEDFINAAVQMGPKRIVYISCGPDTLARDLKLFAAKGYRAKEAWPVDMFAETEHVETVVLLSHKKPDGHINVKVEFGEGKGKVPLDNIAKRAEAYKPKERVTYKMIKEYIEAKYGFKVHTAYIAEVKRDLGLPMYDAPNAVEELKHPRKHPTAEKVEAIKDALRYFGI